MKTKIELEIDLEKFRISLVGDGYLLEEAKKLTDEELIELFKKRVDKYISNEYNKSARLLSDYIKNKI